MSSTDPDTSAGPAEVRILDMGKIVEALRGAGVTDAYIEHTGGGCATLYAGRQGTTADGDPAYLVVGGPGRIDDQSAQSDDFYVGPDDQGESTPWLTPDNLTGLDETAIAALIAAHITALRASAADPFAAVDTAAMAVKVADGRRAIAARRVAAPGEARRPTPHTEHPDWTTTGYAGSDPGDVRYYATYAEAATDPRNLAPGAVLWGLDRTDGQWQQLAAIHEMDMPDVANYFGMQPQTVTVPATRLRQVWADLVEVHASSRRPRATKSAALLAYQGVRTYAALVGVTERAVEQALEARGSEPLTDSDRDAVSDTEYARRVAVLLHTDPMAVPATQTCSACPECGEIPAEDDPDHRTVRVATRNLPVVVVGCEGYHVVNPALIGMPHPQWSDTDGNPAPAVGSGA